MPTTQQDDNSISYLPIIYPISFTKMKPEFPYDGGRANQYLIGGQKICYRKGQKGQTQTDYTVTYSTEMVGTSDTDDTSIRHKIKTIYPNVIDYRLAIKSIPIAQSSDGESAQDYYKKAVSSLKFQPSSDPQGITVTKHDLDTMNVSVVATMNTDDPDVWKKTWTSSNDPKLSTVKGRLSGYYTSFVPPQFENGSGNKKIDFKDGYLFPYEKAEDRPICTVVPDTLCKANDVKPDSCKVSLAPGNSHDNASYMKGGGQLTTSSLGGGPSGSGSGQYSAAGETFVLISNPTYKYSLAREEFSLNGTGTGTGTNSSIPKLSLSTDFKTPASQRSDLNIYASPIKTEPLNIKSLFYYASPTSTQRLSNPYLDEINWEKIQIYDERSNGTNTHPDIEPWTVHAYDFDLDFAAHTFEVKLKDPDPPIHPGPRTTQLAPIRVHNIDINGLRQGSTLSYKKDGIGWQTIENFQPSDWMQKTSTDTLALWDISRLNGKYTLKIENGGSLWLTDVYVGTKVPKQFSDPKNPVIVRSPYNRVTLSFAAGSFDKDTLVTVTPVSLDTVHIKNVTNISDLEYMPIVEILPSADFSKVATKPVLTYQYTLDEYNAINDVNRCKNYGLNAPVDLKNVFIYSIGESGNLKIIDACTHDPDPVKGVYKITAQLDHFSTYVPLEQDFVPELTADASVTQTNIIKLTGKVQTHYASKAKIQFLRKQTDDPNVQPVSVEPSTYDITFDEKGNFTVTNFPLLEGKNMIYVGYNEAQLPSLPYYPKVLTTVEKLPPPELRDIKLDGIPLENPLDENKPNEKPLTFELSYGHVGTWTFDVSQKMTVYIQLLDSKGHVTLELAKPVSQAENVSFVWDGSNQSIVDVVTHDYDQCRAPGTYKLRVYGINDAGTKTAIHGGTICVDYPQTIALTNDLVRRFKVFRARKSISNAESLDITTDVLLEAGESIHLTPTVRRVEKRQFRMRLLPQ